MECEVCHSALPAGALFCGECGSSLARTHSIPVVEAESAPEPSVSIPPAESFIPAAEPDAVTTSTNIVERIEGNDLSELFDAPVERVVEAPRFATPDELTSVTSFTVTLATGESVEITQSALLGRMPQPGEGEEFEHLIVVSDPGRSVSKTHIEFGVDGNEIWVSDRNSGNGSIIREPGVVPRRAQPGTRYTVVRGTRIDIGDLHLTIT